MDETLLFDVVSSISNMGSHKGRHIPGILELNPNMGIGETVDEPMLIWGASEQLEYQDLILYLPVS